MRRRPHLIDRFPGEPASEAPPGPHLQLAPDQAPAPEEEAPAEVKVRGRTSGPVVVTAVIAATVCSIAFRLAPALYGSGLLGGAAAWCGLVAGLIAGLEAARFWWRRPWRN